MDLTEREEAARKLAASVEEALRRIVADGKSQAGKTGKNPAPPEPPHEA